MPVVIMINSPRHWFQLIYIFFSRTLYGPDEIKFLAKFSIEIFSRLSLVFEIFINIVSKYLIKLFWSQELGYSYIIDYSNNKVLKSKV